MLLSLVLAVALSVVAAFFANENQDLVRLQFFGAPLQGPLGIVIVAAFALGAVAGILALLPAYLSQGWSLIRTRRKVEDLERSVSTGMGSQTKQV